MSTIDTKFNPDTVHLYHFRYMREYRAISVLWGLLSIIWCVMNIVVFVQPQWIGDTPQSPGYGHHGVYKYCYPDNARESYQCSGSWVDFNSLLNDSYRACSFFVGVAALLMLIVVAALLLFFCLKKRFVFTVCGILEIITAVFMFLACIIFPSGWNNAEVKKICGTGAGQYQIGECNVRWAYILAILGIFDAAILAILAFFLASKRAKIEMYSASGAVTKSELNGYNTETMSKKSIHMQPAVLTVPMVHGQGGDAYSEYSQVSKPRRNFQL
ncbi:hypothetical protein ACJMK2_016761 [Sinanodonta woodiana]|uniref:Lipoma HMGIC fusion partner-like 3 protein n=1 Tax=Sinanodonta woodiana TaxID=1069815 RepID=A0ABD3UUR1_SINWO